jgi:hypothetical protein
VLLLHDPGSDLDAWGSLPWQLARALPLAVVAIDLPGHGLSDAPWEPERLGDVVRFIAANPHPNPSPIAPSPPDPLPPQRESGWGEGSQCRPGMPFSAKHRPPTPRQFIIAAGSSALTSLALAADLDLAGVVCLSPDAAGDDAPPVRSPRVPKFLVAGSSAGSDLDMARRLAKASGGWAAVTSLAVPARGTALLQTPWGDRLIGDVIVFLRDCLSRPADAPMTGRGFWRTC